MPELIKTKIANRILFRLFRSAWRRYWLSAGLQQETQSGYLHQLIKNNANTRFGIRYNFSKIKSVADFQMQVPISDYEQYIEHIEEIKNGEQSVLTFDRVRKFSVSSGTASASKLIPNTKTLMHEFDNCISVWLYDLYKHIPGLLNGKAFWIISPSTQPAISESQIKNGFDNDSEYFSPVKQWLIRNIFAVPDEVAQFCQGENYYFVLGVFLVSEKNLRLISVWNPSVMIILLEKIFLYQNEIFNSLETGRLNLPEPMEAAHIRILEKKLLRNLNRVNELKAIFGGKPISGALWLQVWPELALISAWDSAWAGSSAKQLMELFPGIAFQGKGLLATEACVTFPVYDENMNNRYFPALTSHFFEFEHLETKEIKRLHELEINCRYEVIVTTGGGFYRYRLNDTVKCYEYANGLPLLSFEGKNNLVSDIAGEKLHENHVQQVLQDIFNELKIESTFHFLAPEIAGKPPFYTLFIKTNSKFNQEELQKCLDAGLNKNFHYRHCRVIDQLGEPQVFSMNDNLIDKFYTTIQKGNKLGSFKQISLRKEIFWRTELTSS
jgi:hypothetical protein